MKIVNNTSNIAIDSISAALRHYNNFNKKVSVIYLSHNYWEKFVTYAMQSKPDLVIIDQMDFKNVSIKKGHAFMLDNLEVELKEQKPVLN